MSKNTKSFFELHAHDYSRDQTVYDTLTEKIRKLEPRENLPLILDMGCGRGNFIKAMIERNIKARYLGTDLSSRMIEIARSNVSEKSADFLIADGFRIPVRSNVKFDVIHIDSLLHHLVDSNRAKSIVLVRNMIDALLSQLSPNGMLIVEELYYDSYIIPQITSYLIFYILKIVNFLGLDLTPFIKEMKPGLEVNFFSKDELSNILEEYGSTEEFSRVKLGVPPYYRLMLLRHVGYITYILKYRRT